ncbi:MAG: hypothetical protein LBE83_03475 [Propionibacteriaceae bacterium]|jgi:hypothetical protein|nr:hypothetical protein [Propionibacteriaceae bacterium]
MACLLVPATQALIVTAAKSRVKETPAKASRSGISWGRKLTWLTTMLWGGALLLGLEHIWHGEITAAFPFLPALTSLAGIQAMAVELATTGVAMALTVTVVWGLMVAAVEFFPRLATAVSPKA